MRVNNFSDDLFLQKLVLHQNICAKRLTTKNKNIYSLINIIGSIKKC